ncbi:MAG: alpha/beta hydrolase [Desulfatitalea sp.]|nr:alpha/beta hydrolase [Desulfatitalea sp.]
MSSADPPNYALLDRPEVLAAIFHPLGEWGLPSSADDETAPRIPVAPGTYIGTRFHIVASAAATILFFHGNGEIAADYDELGPLYNQMGINFLVADYRGYGRSNGQPTVSAMMSDGHLILAYVRQWLADHRQTGPLVVMGRSLGSASALELAAAHPEQMDGLIVESGFAYAEPLLRLLGVNLGRLGFKEDQGFGNLDKIRRYVGPTLIIHAEYDRIIPFSDGQALYDASGAAHKRLLRIEGANHNDIFARGLTPYLQAVRDLVEHLLKV